MPRRSPARAVDSGVADPAASPIVSAPFSDDTSRDAPDDAPTSLRRRLRHGLPDEAPVSGTYPLPFDAPEPRAKPKTSARRYDAPAPRSKPRPHGLWHEVAGVLSFASGAVLLVNALRSRADNVFAVIGVGGLRYLFGIGDKIVPVILCALGILLIARRHHANLRAFGRGVGVAFLVLLTGVHLSTPRGYEFASNETVWSKGGLVGGTLAYLLRAIVGEIGAFIALAAFAVVALLLWSEVSLADLVSRLSRAVMGLTHRTRDNVRDAFLPPYRAEPDPFSAAARPESPIPDADAPETPAPIVLRRPNRPVAAATTPIVPPDPDIRPMSPFVPIADPEVLLADTPKLPIEPLQSAPDPLTPVELLEKQAQNSASSPASSAKSPASGKQRRFLDGPLMPEYFDAALNAFDAPVPQDFSGVDDDVSRGVQAVTETLASFRIDARVVDVKRGPVITRYEVQPAPGVRVAAIANLDRDLARSLSAIAVRIEAPVPGKNVVGIEVPNKVVHLVRLRDVLELPEYLAAPSKLSFVLGRDISGAPKWADLTKMPHLLIAGATNSGKSVCLNAIIASIMVRADPSEVKFSLIDPKRVELTLFRDIKHLYHPVVVEPKDAVKALRGAIAEMDQRYRKFAQRGVRNIASFNSKLGPDEPPLPYLVIVIDELADLMMTAAAEFEKLICRLAQLARATGIHLIVATQRPSVNVITGVIKANIPARIAFAVASQVDSRTILDAQGAERLIGSGDMLFDANNGGKAVRIQGAYLSEDEVNRVVTVVKEHYYHDEKRFDYGMDINEYDDGPDASDKDDKGVSPDKRDELYDAIREFVIRHEEMSASNIQRKFEIGYPRAGRIVDQLERDGILSPADGQKARKVIGTGA